MISASFEDMFLAERPVRADNLIYIVDSNSLSAGVYAVSDIYDDIIAEYVAAHSFGSMAYEDRKTYASAVHDHDIYTSAYYTQTSFDSNSRIIAEFNELTTMSAPVQYKDTSSEKADIVRTFEPKIGEMKFTCSPIVENPAACEDFDGWVYPDGRIYDASEFEYGEKLLQIYGTPAPGKFQIPVLSNFIKYRNESDIPEIFDFQKNPGINTLPKHSHVVDLNQFVISSDQFLIEIPITVAMQPDFIGNEKTVKYPHFGKMSKATEPPAQRTASTIDHAAASLIFSSDSSGMDYTEETEHESESYPTYNLMPTMVYIGPKK